ncbi:MAG: hypothetical protein AAGA35_02270 [Patescibacteria group bacterium]
MTEDRYSQFVIKQFKHWKLQIFENQGYLGRCIVWCDRENALELTDVTEEEYLELLEIIKLWQQATKDCFEAEWHNYSFLGNITAHLHGHLVPRYSGSRTFAGITFTDALWGQRYQTDTSFVTPEPVLKKIQKELTDWF